MAHSVLLLTRYGRKGPSSRIRHYEYLPALERAGFRVATSALLSDEYVEHYFQGKRPSLRLLIGAYANRLRRIITASRYDLLWIEKEALPWVPALVELSLLYNLPFIVDFDDPWYLRYANHTNSFVRARLRGKFEAIAARAGAVTVGGPALKDWACSVGFENIVEIPPAVDLRRYPLRPPPDGPLTIGWIGTPPNERYLALIAEPLRRLQVACGARVRVIGGSEGFSIPGVKLDHVSWSEHSEAEEISRCHIGIMPLLDGPWERGKCGYKLIQYMAAGRVAVASAVGPSKSIIVEGETGFLARDNREWIAILTDLASDPSRVRTMGLAARRRAETKYSLQYSAEKLVSVMLNAIGGSSARFVRNAAIVDPSETAAIRVTTEHRPAPSFSQGQL